MSDENSEEPKFKVVFMPGCFDSFDGTQEELDEMIAEIERMAADGSLMDDSTAFEPGQDLSDYETLTEEQLAELKEMEKFINDVFDGMFDADGEVYNRKDKLN